MWSNQLQPIRSMGKIVRKNALRTAWMMFALVPMVMLYNPARADGSVQGVHHEVVSFKDLNLDSPEGAAVLYRRIMSAAYKVCEDPRSYDLSQLKLQVCIREAVSTAIDQVNRPALTNLYHEKMGRSDKKVMLAQAH